MFIQFRKTAAGCRESLPANHPMRAMVPVVAAVVLEADFPICISPVMAAPFSSASVMLSIQWRSRREPERDREPELVRGQVQELGLAPEQAEEREQGKARVQAVDAGASTSTCAFASIVQPNGPRCSTMAGAR